MNRRTLRSTWSKAPPGGSRPRASRTTDVHETVNSVVARMVAADDTDDEGSLVLPRPSSRLEEAAAGGQHTWLLQVDGAMAAAGWMEQPALRELEHVAGSLQQVAATSWPMLHRSMKSHIQIVPRHTPGQRIQQPTATH